MTVFCLEYADECTATDPWGSFTARGILVDKSVGHEDTALRTIFSSYFVIVHQGLSENGDSSNGVLIPRSKVILEKLVVAQRDKVQPSTKFHLDFIRLCRWTLTLFSWFYDTVPFIK